jgi:hypothetical protein
MMTSKDEKVKKAMRWFTGSERQHRIIEEDQNAQFLNWKTEEGTRERNRINHCEDEKHLLQDGSQPEDE